MKIALFTDTYLPTVNGVSYAVESWKEELERRGHSVTVFCPAPGRDDSDATFKSFEIPFYDGYHAAYYPPENDISDFDAIHINSFFLVGYWGYRAARKHNLKLVSVVHTPIKEYLNYVTGSKTLQRIIGRLYQVWESRMLKRSDTCIALSDHMESHIEEMTGRDDVERLTNGVNTRFFHPQKTDSFRERYDVKSQKVIGYTGRLSSEKRVGELIEFAEQFEGEVLIGGDGPQRDKLEQKVESENVKFLGFLDREELPEFYSVIDLFVFPSRVENDPLTVLESTACGTPVIGADAAGLKDSIQEGKNGYLYEPGDIGDLADKIGKGYGNLPELSKGALRHSKKNSIAKTVDRLIELYSNREKST